MRHRIAVVGAGPTGKGAARVLSEAGQAVVVFDREPEGGGMLRYGYPAERMPDQISQRDTERLRGRGVRFEFGRELGRNLTLDELAEYDAVLLAVGAVVPRRLGVLGEDLPEVHTALEFLKASRSTRPISPGRRALIVGGGDTSVDAATTALSLDATEAAILYRGLEDAIPAQERELETAHKNGVMIRPHSVVTKIESGLRVHLASSSPATVTIEEWDTLIVAIGQAVDSGLFRKLGLTVHPDGTTDRPKIFVAGESRYGAGRLASAVKDAQRAGSRILDALA